MDLYTTVKNSARRLAVPLAGFPGVALIGESIKNTLCSKELHVKALSALVEQVQPDGAFVIMDLTLEAEALGLPIRMPDNEAPSVAAHPIKTLADLKRLAVPDPKRDGRLPIYLDTVSRLAPRLPIPLGGYVIGPFTLACELMGAQEFAEKTILEPELVEEFLDFTVEVSKTYARDLIVSGVKMIAVLEPSAMFLSLKMFNNLLTARLRGLMEAISRAGAAPILHICGNTTHLLSGMAQSGAQGLSLDSPVDFPSAVGKVPPEIVLIGNLDPVGVVMQGTPTSVSEAAKKLMREMAAAPNFILSGGCDLPPETPIANIQALVRAVKE